MDYKGLVKGSYSYDLDSYFNSHSGETMAFLYGSNEIAFVENDGLPSDQLIGFDQLCYYTTSQLRTNGYDRPVAFLYPGADDYFYFVGSQYLDYALFSIDNYSFDVLGLKATSDNHWIDDLDLLNNYGTLTQRGEGDDNPAYSSYQYNDILDSVVFDYSNLHYENSSYNQQMLAVRGENISFYYSVVRINFDNLGVFSFEYGRPLGDAREQGYSSGYGAGYSSGLVDGIDQGYQQGLSAGGGDIGTQSATAFSFIGSAFNAAGGVLSIEVLPNITLGTCFAIPMVFVLIITLFKLVRK